MWTGDGRVFFYNPSSRTSVWDRPEDLVGRPDVDKAIAESPEQLGGVAVTVEKTEKPSGAVEQTNDTPAALAVKRSESESSEAEDVPHKKFKAAEQTGMQRQHNVL